MTDKRKFIVSEEEGRVIFALIMSAIGVFFLWVGKQVLYSPNTANWSDFIRAVPFFAATVAFIPALKGIYEWIQSPKKNILPYSLPPDSKISFVVRNCDLR